MASPELLARLRYLNESAHLLATTAPETSRHLMSRCTTLIFDNQVEQDNTRKKKACGACGALIIPSWEGSLETHSERLNVSKKGNISDRSVPQRTIIYECGTCGKKTTERAKAPPPVKRHPVALKASKPVAVMGAAASPASTTSTSSSSKKRAKSRKGGLAAILAQKTSTDASKSGFDLMDFMKKV